MNRYPGLPGDRNGRRHGNRVQIDGKIPRKRERDIRGAEHRHNFSGREEHADGQQQVKQLVALDLR